MSSKRAHAPEEISFEEGYDELKALAARIGRDDVSVHEKFEDFRRGKGLERALRDYLSGRQGELTEIEEGKNLPEFRIVAPSSSFGRSAGSCEAREAEAGGLVGVPVERTSSAAEADVPF